MALLWKKKKKLDPSQARKACSGEEALLSPWNPSCGSPGEQALFRLQCYRWELPQRRNLLQPGGKVLRLDFSLFSTVAKQMRSSNAPLEGFECGLLSPPFEAS